MKGVFWLIEDKLYSFPYRGDSVGVAKSGTTYNHKKLWPEVKPKGINKPYNYYPRGRVEITNKGTVVIWLNPIISEDWIPQIKTDFELSEEPIIKYDNSKHYKCYLDDGWRE